MKDIDYICEQLVNIVHGEVTRFTTDGEIIKTYGIEKNASSFLVLDPAVKKEACNCPAKEFPEIRMELDAMIFALLFMEEERILIGPVSIRKHSERFSHQFAELHGMKESGAFKAAYCELKVFGSAVLLGFHALTGKNMALEELWEQNGVVETELESVNKDVSGIIFERQEYDTPHNPYDQELRELDSITQGNTEMLKASIEESYRGQEGQMAEDEIRQEKNIAIVVIALASRAAIKGGMLPEKAFSMVDAYVLAIERLKDPIKIRSMMRKAEFDFTEQVAANSRALEQNEIIQHAKNYIFQHLHGEIVISELGRQIGVNPSYLSTLFRKSEGITLQLFIRNEKIKLAENMLRYSDYNIRDISNYLFFCSQSHFGKAFKEQTGMSPAKYRRMYRAVREGEL